MKKMMWLLSAVLLTSAFMAPDQDPQGTKMVQKLILMLNKIPQEKVYLSTDRDHYNAGDTVWFRAWEVSAATHRLPGFSRFVYVELVDRLDTVFQRIKIPFRDSIFAGYVPLNKEIKQGEYFLRAYSYWMQNQGEDFIFKKKIYVLNPQDTKVVTQVTYEEKDGDYFAVIRFANSRNTVYPKTSLEYEINHKIRYAHTDEKGIVRIKLDTKSMARNLRIKFREDFPFAFERNIPLLAAPDKYDVQFFPEGGDLLAGCSQNVAYKAVKPNGLAQDIFLWVYNEKDELICGSQSLYKGMGGFELPVEPGRRYYAIVSTPDSIRKRIELPEPKHYGLALKTVLRDSLLYYTVLCADSTQMPEDLSILAHSRGVPLFCMPLKTHRKGKVELPEMQEGIVQFVLLDSKARVYSQRLCFVRGKHRPEVEITSDKSVYNVRDLVNMEVNIKTFADKSPAGSFSVAVTDDPQSAHDSLADNIHSYLLLTSDLKGYIEEPAWYFQDVNRLKDRCLDILLMTQGWTRFDVAEVLKGEYPDSPWYMERGQTVSGKVKNFWGKDAAQASLFLLGTNGLFQMVSADSSGHFMIDGIAFPEGTRFVLQGRSQKGRRSVEVMVDKDEFLKPALNMPYGEQTMAQEDDFLKKFSKDYYYDHGIKVYVLDEAVVKKHVAPKQYSSYDNMASYRVDSARLAQMGEADLRTILLELPGVMMEEDKITRYGKTLYLVLDEFEEDFDRIQNMRASELISISLLDDMHSYMMFGNKARNGALILTSNPHFVKGARQRLNMAVFSLLGYQRKAQFYVPRYDIDSVRMALADTSDWRPTLYWNPNVKTDVTGRARFSFTTSDSYGPYTLIIEGILNDGTVFRKEKKIQLKL